MIWKYRIRITSIFKKYEKGKISAEEAGKLTAEKIKKSKAYKYFKSLKNIVKRFEKIKTEAQYNNVLNSLYDFGDNNQVWIEHIV